MISNRSSRLGDDDDDDDDGPLLPSTPRRGVKPVAELLL
jgi:hypothetical protein